MQVGIPKEILLGERRVAAVPETIIQMISHGFTVCVESGAGEGALITDHEYEQSGAIIAQSAHEVFAESDIILKVNRLMVDQITGRLELNDLRDSSILIGNLQVLRYPETIHALKYKKVTSYSLDCLPRIARAQSMDVLSSMSNIAGYKSVLMAAAHLPKFFPMLTTAAGSIPPARVFVIGAGVAGLQAIATARRLGAMVAAFDPRPEVEEQVKSLGASFVPMKSVAPGEDVCQQEQALLSPYVQGADVVITTALIPGRPAPVLITASMVSMMRPGSVIVDLAAEQGGNCVLSEAGTTQICHGVTIIAETHLPSLMAVDASRLYAKNIFAFLKYIFPNPADSRSLLPEESDEIIRSTRITHGGYVVHPALLKQPEPEAQTI